MGSTSLIQWHVPQIRRLRSAFWEYRAKTTKGTWKRMRHREHATYLAIPCTCCTAWQMLLHLTSMASPSRGHSQMLGSSSAIRWVSYRGYFSSPDSALHRGRHHRSLCTNNDACSKWSIPERHISLSLFRYYPKFQTRKSCMWVRVCVPDCLPHTTSKSAGSWALHLCQILPV